MGRRHIEQEVKKKEVLLLAHGRVASCHLVSLNQDIVALSQKEKCGLKYVMQTFRRSVRTLAHSGLAKQAS